MSPLKPIYLIGDTHGQWDSVFSLLDKYDIKNCTLISVGDIGIGFKVPDKQNKEIELVNQRFKKRDIRFMGIRGNHDDPAYFRGDVTLSNFELIRDYTLKILNDEKFLFVGGAVSIDRRLRVPNMSWWEGEEFCLIKPAIKKCDVVITHSPPFWSGPYDKAGVEAWCAQDPTLWDECVKERKDIAELIELCEAKKHYCGHMHTSSWVDYLGCFSRILNINEIYEHSTTL